MFTPSKSLPKDIYDGWGVQCLVPISAAPSPEGAVSLLEAQPNSLLPSLFIALGNAPGDILPRSNGYPNVLGTEEKAAGFASLLAST